MRFFSPSSVVFIFLFLVTFSSAAQNETFNDEKFSVGAGIGWEYGIIGVNGKYFFTENIGITASLLVWNIGIEANFPFTFKNRWMPYVTIRYGLNSTANLNNAQYDPYVPPSSIEKRWFCGFIYGAGIKYNYNKGKRRYLTLSTNYVDRTSAISDFVEGYNKEYGTNYSTEFKDFIRPSLGMVFYFN